VGFNNPVVEAGEWMEKNTNLMQMPINHAKMEVQKCVGRPKRSTNHLESKGDLAKERVSSLISHSCSRRKI
jgi:hypothetical protein